MKTGLHFLVKSLGVSNLYEYGIQMKSMTNTLYVFKFINVYENEISHDQIVAQTVNFSTCISHLISLNKSLRGYCTSYPQKL